VALRSRETTAQHGSGKSLRDKNNNGNNNNDHDDNNNDNARLCQVQAELRDGDAQCASM